MRLSAAQSLGVHGRRAGGDVRAHRPGDARLRRGAQRAAVRDRRGIPGLQAGTARRAARRRTLAERQAVRPVPARRVEGPDHVVPRRLQQCRHRRRDAGTDPRLGRQRVRRLLRGGHRADRRAAEGPAGPRRDVPHTNARAVELIADARGITGVRITHDGKDIRVRARRGVVLGTGGFEWDAEAGRGVSARPDARRRCHRRTTPATACGWRWHTAPTWRTWARRGGCRSSRCPATPSRAQPRSRSVRLERTRPRSIIVNRAGKRFLNEAGEYNSMAGPFHYLDPRDGYANDPAWIVFDSQHLKRYGFLGVPPDGPAPDWFCRRPTWPNWARRRASTPTAWPARSTAWNENVAHEHDPDFGRGSSAYDGYWGDDNATTTAGKTLGPDRHRPVLRGPGVDRRDGHQGRPAHRPRRPRPARQRRADPGAVRRGQRDGGRDRQGLRRRRRDPRPRNGFRLPRRPGRVSAFLAGRLHLASRRKIALRPAVSGQLCVCSPGISRRSTSRRNSCPTGTRR